MDFKTAVTLPFLVAKVLIYVFSAASVGMVWRPKQWSYIRNLKSTFFNSMIKTGLFNLIINPKSMTTLGSYRLYMKSQRAEPNVVMFDDETGGGWIGSPEAKNVLIYYHGGAYTNPGGEIHMQFLGAIVNAARDHGKDLAVFVAQYGLSPEVKYPTALIDSVKALNYVLETTKRDPANIFLSGDSSGGNLALGLISHLSHPHPSASNVDLKGNILAGAFVIGAWVTFQSSSESIFTNADVDFIEQRVLIPQSQGFLGSAEEDYYNVPLSASPEWWGNLKVKDLLLIAGGYEIFRDDIVALAKKIQVHNPNVEYFVAPAEIHVQPLVDRGLRLGVAKSEVRIVEWLLPRL